MSETEIKQTRECPYCKSSRVESMGFKDSTNKVRRYRCKACNRSHSRDAITYFLRVGEQDMNETEQPKEKSISDKANQTLNVRIRTKERVRNIKLHDRETDDDLINRLLDEHYFLNNLQKVKI